MSNSKTDNIKKLLTKPLFCLSILTLTGCHTTGRNMIKIKVLSESKTLDLGNNANVGVLPDTALDNAGGMDVDGVRGNMSIKAPVSCGDPTGASEFRSLISTVSGALGASYNDSNAPLADVDKNKFGYYRPKETLSKALFVVGIFGLLGTAVGFSSEPSGSNVPGFVTVCGTFFGVSYAAIGMAVIYYITDNDAVARDSAATDGVKGGVSKFYSRLT